METSKGTAFSRGHEKAGINHIGKNQKPGPDATNQFQIHQANCQNKQLDKTLPMPMQHKSSNS